jgi:hypothetical protein
VDNLCEAIGWGLGDKGLKVVLWVKRDIVGKLLNRGADFCSAYAESPMFVALICCWIRYTLQVPVEGERGLLSELLKVRRLFTEYWVSAVSTDHTLETIVSFVLQSGTQGE